MATPSIPLSELLLNANKIAQSFKPTNGHAGESVPIDPLENVFIPTWTNKPDPVPDVIKLNGTGILTYQNLLTLIAYAGAGKTSVGEAMISAYLNSESDCLGLSVDQTLPGFIAVDCERTETDVWNSYWRVTKRAGIAVGQPMKNVIMAGVRAIPRLGERKKAIEHLLEKNPCGLLLIDGAADLVKDTNDLEEAIECRIWFREITVKYKCSIVTTIHPNPNTTKPRGHQGSELWRESEGCALIKKYDENTKTITTDFDMGKSRNNQHTTSAFRWSEEHMMFMSADLDLIQIEKSEANEQRKKQELQTMARKIIPATGSIKSEELLKKIMDEKDCKADNAKKILRQFRDSNIAVSDNGYYRLVV